MTGSVVLLNGIVIVCLCHRVMIKKSIVSAIIISRKCEHFRYNNKSTWDREQCLILL